MPRQSNQVLPRSTSGSFRAPQHEPARRPSTSAPLGIWTPAAFLRRHWHKRALLIRDAFAAATHIVDLPALKRLAARDDVEARLVVRSGSRWSVEHGPFPARTWRALPATHWTLLVSGLNYFVPAAQALLQRFAFVPHARLDDVMVSYASPHGGVGPHFDSYDVFLLQGPGRRRWRLSAQSDLRLAPGAPLKILQRFRAEQTMVLQPGDMLYLPPRIAHEGTAIDACFTFSIGFRAPTHAELLAAYADYMQEHRPPPGRYADPDLTPTRTPARLPSAMVARARTLIERAHPRAADVAAALGVHLSTPKATIVFAPPAEPVGHRTFVAAIARSGLHLDPRTLMLYRAQALFINGEPVNLHRADRRALHQLADARVLHSARFSAKATTARVYDWYRAGWIHIGIDP